MNLRRIYILVALSLLGFDAARAQALVGPTAEYNRGRNVGVTERPHPEYDAAGMPLGAFRLYPTLATELAYTDNVFASDTNTVSDEIVRVSPAFSLSSNWSRNALGLSAQLSRDFHFDVPSEDNTTYLVQGTGRWDVTPDLNATLLAAHSRATESRETSTSAAAAAKPSQYDQDTVSLTAVDQIDRLRLRGTISYVASDYENLPALAGGVVQNDLRDDTLQTYGVRADFAVTPDTAVFASVEYNDRSFDNSGPTGSLDSHGYSALAGANFDVTSLMRGEVGVGYFDQTLDRGGHSSGLATAARLQYYPTQLTDITATVNRSFADSTEAGSSGVVRTGAALSVDHELLRNLLLNAKVQFSRDDYADFDRREDRTVAGLGATWRLNRGVSVNGAFEHHKQESKGSVPGLSYDTNYLVVGVTFRR